MVYRNTLNLGKVAGKNYAFGPACGVGLTAGFDWNTKNDTGYASKKRMLVIGPTLMLDVPGFLNVSLLVLQESNMPKSITSCYTFKTHPMLTAARSIPVSAASGLSFERLHELHRSQGLEQIRWRHLA